MKRMVPFCIRATLGVLGNPLLPFVWDCCYGLLLLDTTPVHCCCSGKENFVSVDVLIFMVGILFSNAEKLYNNTHKSTIWRYRLVISGTSPRREVYEESVN